MVIGGLQKLTLLDFPGHTACTVFTGGCNFRCPFCHNALLVTEFDADNVWSEKEFFDFLGKRRGILDGVAITGGEPTLHRDLPDFIRRVRDEGFSVKLDSNGTNPAMLRALIDDGLVDYVAMDIKNSKEKYAATAGVERLDLAPIEESVGILMEGKCDYEFRTTVVGGLHQEEDFVAIGEWIRGARRYFLQGLVDSGNCIEQGFWGYGKEQMEVFLAKIKPFVTFAEIRGQ